MTTDDAQLQQLVADTFVALASALETQPSDAWDTPSLCAGWRVREVVAHVTMPARYRDDEFMAMLAAEAFDFTRLSNRIAQQDAQLATDVLVANLRDSHLHEWTPPGGGAAGALNHAVIHALDATIPIGVVRPMSDAAIVRVLDDLTHGGIHKHFGVEIPDEALTATDVDWKYGAGPERRAPAEDLVLMLSGRTR